MNIHALTLHPFDMISAVNCCANFPSLWKGFWWHRKLMSSEGHHCMAMSHTIKITAARHWTNTRMSNDFNFILLFFQLTDFSVDTAESNCTTWPRMHDDVLLSNIKSFNVLNVTTNLFYVFLNILVTIVAIRLEKFHPSKRKWDSGSKK